MMDYESIKLLAKEVKCRVRDLIALAPKNDPFYVGTPTDWKKAHWFTDLWHRFGYTTGVHLRRMHYRIISQEKPVLLHDGLPYENTERCWDYLGEASKKARYLEMVDPAAFVDRRNPDPRIYREWHDSTPSIYVEDDWEGLDDIQLPEFPDIPDYSIDDFYADQRYHLEIWCEKSTMDDILDPLGRRYGVNIQTGVGEMSITSVCELSQRFRTDKPSRILYISDFDPAGQSMPVAASRKAEYFVNKMGREGYNVRLFPLVMTIDQVQQYQLPRTPIKDGERRAGAFEERYGEGAVELDALEALYPGELERILVDTIAHYYDGTLSRRTVEVYNELVDDLDERQQAVIDEHAAELEELQQEYEVIRREFAGRIAQVSGRVSVLYNTMRAELRTRVPDINDYPIPKANEGEEFDDGLYNSRRDYIDQIMAYKQFQGKLDQ